MKKIESSKQLLQLIVNLATRFYEGEKSIITLIRESSYINRYEEITENDIAQALKSNSTALRDWWQLAEDNRSSDGWKLGSLSQNYYYVVFRKQGEDIVHHTFSDEVSSCARYILMKLESVRQLNDSKAS